MAQLNMNGPFDLNQDTIDRIIPNGIPGNYAYGYMENNTFIVQYVGRSDTNLRERIGHGIGKYSLFKASIASSAQEAYNKECINWHDFGGEDGLLDNKIHPAKPERGLGVCPVCAKRVLDAINRKK